MGSWVWRSISQTWLTCGNGRSGGVGRSWMVRVVIRGVAFVDVAVGDRGVGPGQGVQRGEQRRLIMCDGEHEVSADRVEIGGVLALCVESIRGDHHIAQVDTGGGEPVQQRGEHRDLVRFRADLDLAQHQLLAVSRGREQVGLVALGVDGATDGLAVHRDRQPWRLIISRHRFLSRHTKTYAMRSRLSTSPEVRTKLSQVGTHLRDGPRTGSRSVSSKVWTPGAPASGTLVGDWGT